MNNGKHNYQQILKSALSLLLSVMVLCGNLVTTFATADDTQYFAADGQVIIAPSPTVTAPVGNDAQITVDDLLFTVSLSADTVASGASCAVRRVSNEDVLHSVDVAWLARDFARRKGKRRHREAAPSFCKQSIVTEYPQY